jgi:hypothetical protein
MGMGIVKGVGSRPDPLMTVQLQLASPQGRTLAWQQPRGKAAGVAL